MSYYPEFSVPGVPADQIWRLFNVSSLDYYLQTVEAIRCNHCSFCHPNPQRIIFESAHWYVMESNFPRSDDQAQVRQLVCPLKIKPGAKHVENIADLTGEQWADYAVVIRAMKQRYPEDRGENLVLRSGDAQVTAKSMPHLHFNWHVCTGNRRFELTFAKDRSDLEEKVPLLRVFEQVRLNILGGSSVPIADLRPEERALLTPKRLGKFAVK